MKLLLKLLTAMLAGMVISYAMLIDSIVKKLVEQEGSKALRAKVELLDAEFHLYPTSLTLRGLAATNPQEPMKNLITANEISGNLDLRALLANKIILESVTVSDLRLQQARATSGAIDGVTAKNIHTNNTEKKLLSGTDSQAIIDSVKQQLQGNIENYNKQAVDIKTQWQQRREQFNANTQLDALKKRWRDLQTASTREKLNGIRNLKKAVNAEFSRAAKIANDLQIDLAVTGEIQQQAQALINSQTDAALTGSDSAATVTRGNLLSANRLSDRLLADSLKITAGQFMAMYKTDQQTGAPQPWPLLIKQLSFNGQLELGANAIPVAGSINNANSSAAQWQLPTTFTIKSTAQNSSGALTITGTLDHRQPQQANDRIDFNLQDAPVSALSLSRASDVRVVLGQAIATINGYVVLRNNQLEVMINNRFKQAQLIIETNVNGSSNGAAAENSLATTLAETLRGIDRFDLQISGNGTLNNAINNDGTFTLSATSSLDPLLANAAKQFLKTAQDALKPQIQAALQTSMDSSLNELANTRRELETINGEISTYQQALKNLLTTF